MKLEGEQVLCRFHMTSFVHVHHQPLYERIVETAHRLHLAGATVLKGLMGFSLGGPLLLEKAWAFSNELPVVVEVVESHRNVIRLLGAVQPEFHHGIITLERAHVLYYRSSKSAPTDAPALDAAEDPETLEGAPTMKLPDEGVLLRIFIDAGDRDPKTGKPLAEMLVRRAHAVGMAGATVLHGTLGFGKHSRLHAAKLLDISTDLPVVIEIVDSEERINDFLPIVDEAVTEGLVTLEAVRVLKYVAPEPAPSPPRPEF